MRHERNFCYSHSTQTQGFWFDSSYTILATQIIVTIILCGPSYKSNTIPTSELSFFFYSLLINIASDIINITVWILVVGVLFVRVFASNTYSHKHSAWCVGSLPDRPVRRSYSPLTNTHYHQTSIILVNFKVWSKWCEFCGHCTILIRPQRSLPQ